MATYLNKDLCFGLIDVPFSGASQALNSMYSVFPDFKQRRNDAASLPIPVHASITDLHRVIGSAIFDYFLVAFVRNTFELLLVRYNFVKSNPRHPDHERCLLYTFEDYVFAEGQTVRIREQHPMVLSETSGVTLIANSRCFSNVLREILTELGAPPEIFIPRPPELCISYREYYSETMREHVSKVYAEDIKKFGFEFD
ncbi:hypothetical protein [Ponticaulis profundi]|uniref:Sulfotransferase family protein n=1 Tax=Ponticaulis profundi TaxID=2665222 RepID=A0ABW1SDV0_9PROT